MSKTTKVLLVLSVTLLAAGLVFVTGLVNVGEAAALYVALPAGAILFGLFLISRCLQAETALFDEEQKMAIDRASRTVPEKYCYETKPAGKASSLASAHAR